MSLEKRKEQKLNLKRKMFCLQVPHNMKAHCSNKFPVVFSISEISDPER